MKYCTLIFPRKNGMIGLARKRQPIHIKNDNLAGSENIWNGWGGKREWCDLFSISLTAVREFWQESGAFCFPWNLNLVARINFHWPGDIPGKPKMHAYIYFIDSWLGEMRAGAEMGEPVFFTVNAIPYQEMMKGDKVFLPRLIAGETFVANVYFDKKDEQGNPSLEIIKTPVSDIPWYTQVYVLGLIAWKRMLR